ncbi:MAG: hypothetical protein LQ348_000444 [Seirophora lacunosa]|nr:MAG: hypothetical protein LQ348_000444 [Seirophora lacunosa]
MAAPDNIDILDVTGHWSLNQNLSDSLEDTFALQGIPWIVRKVINVASLELSFQQDLPETEDAPIRFTVKQTVRPGGFDSSNEYILDGKTRYDTVPIFGEVSATNVYVGHDEVTKADSLQREIEQISGQSTVGIMEKTVGIHTGWTSRTLWAFERVEGQRRLCKYATTTKDDQKATARMLFDYLGPPQAL